MRIELCALGLVLVAASACKQADESGEAGASCAGDFNCKNGFLCEANVCVPKALAEKVRAQNATATSPQAPATAAAPPAPAAVAATAPSVVDEGPIPPIPTEPSNPPQGVEWKEGKAVNTQEPNSQPDTCDVRVLREWLQVTCRGDYFGYEKMENFGRKFADYYESVDPGRVVSFVLRMKRGRTQAVRICGTDKRASLFVNWPAASDRPKHLALGKGPACDGSQWGAYLKKTGK